MRRVLIGVVVLALLGCGGDGDDETAASSSSSTSTSADDAEGTEGTEDGAAVCDAARRIADLDDEVQGVVNDELQGFLGAAGEPGSAEATEGFEQLITAVEEVADQRLPELEDAYAELEAGLPEELAADAATVRDFTVQFLEVLRGVETPDDLEAAFTDLTETGAVEAGQATLRLDEYTRRECDIVLAD